MNRKLALFSILILGVLFGGGFFYWKNLRLKDASNWNIYKNQKYKIQFKYPKEWGNLTLRSKENQLYVLKPENEKVQIVFYHKPSGVIAFIERGEKYKLVHEGENYQEILKVIDQNKRIKTIYIVPPQKVEWYGNIGRVNISPNGKYIAFILFGYESSTPFMFNIETGRNIFEGLPIWFDNPAEKIYWSKNNKVLVVKSERNEFGGEGMVGLFVSDYDNPDKLGLVFSLSPKEILDGIYIGQVQFLDEDRVGFEIGKKGIKYLYNVKTKELEMLGQP